MDIAPLPDHEGFLPTVDSDDDGLPDTVLETDDGDLVLRTDLDGDGDPDREVRIDEAAASTVRSLPEVPEVDEPGTAAAAAGRMLQAGWDPDCDDDGAAVPPVSVDPETGRWTT